MFKLLSKIVVHAREGLHRGLDYAKEDRRVLHFDPSLWRRQRELSQNDSVEEAR